MKYEDLKTIISIPEIEKDGFKQLIRDLRSEIISSPSDIVNHVFEQKRELIASAVKERKVTKAIHNLRESAYELFLIEEAEFNVKVLKEITEKLETPSEILDTLIEHKLQLHEDKTELLQSIQELCGEYAGRISPYIYELCLSNTQSRRSRAGKTFEAIIYRLYEEFEYPYVSQGSVGRAEFQNHGLGKMVDSLLPSIECFEQRRDRVVIGTMKTTLRERWQEVVEELQRTGLPCIYLLTMDDQISKGKAEQMGKHNVIIVVPDYVKEKEGVKDMRNIISFETYFLTELPETLKYWDS